MDVQKQSIYGSEVEIDASFQSKIRKHFVKKSLK